jgi:RNA recognition motif-containing protein
MIDKSHYISVLGDQASMAEFAAPSTTRYADGRTEDFVSPNNAPNRTLWFGNIPNELLAEKEEIVTKFSKYGKIADVRIREFNSILFSFSN